MTYYQLYKRFRGWHYYDIIHATTPFGDRYCEALILIEDLRNYEVINLNGLEVDLDIPVNGLDRVTVNDVYEIYEEWEPHTDILVKFPTESYHLPAYILVEDYGWRSVESFSHNCVTISPEYHISGKLF